MFNTGARVQEAPQCACCRRAPRSSAGGTTARQGSQGAGLSVVAGDGKPPTRPYRPTRLRSRRDGLAARLHERPRGTPDALRRTLPSTPLRADGVTSGTLPQEQEASPHSIQHSTAVALLKSEVDFATISQWLGHAATTRRATAARRLGPCRLASQALKYVEASRALAREARGPPAVLPTCL